MIYEVTLNTSSLVGHPAGPFYVELALTDGSGFGDANNTVTLSNFKFGGSGLGSPFVLGGGSGSLETGVSMIDSSFLSLFIEQFASGPQLSFSLHLTSNDDASAIPDGLTFIVLDSSGVPVPTLAPGGGYFLTVALGSSGPVFSAYGSDPSRSPTIGNPIAIDPPTVTSDTVPPLTTAVASPLANAAGWNNTNVTVTLNSTDGELGGTGVKQIVYAASGAQAIPSTTLPASLASFTVSAEGITAITFFGTDNAGNVETSRAITIKLDKTPPSITSSRAPTANGIGWNNSGVTVSFQCADSLSGLAAGSPPGPTTLSSQGAGQSVSRTCQDLSGNTSTSTVSGINIDTTPPTIGITTPANGVTYSANQSVNAAYACNDAVSGVATCSGSVPSGSKIDTAPSGVSTTNTFTVNATDVAGNPASQLVSYQVSCHYVALGISPSIAARGSLVKVTGTIMSCTNAAQTVSLKFTLTGPLGPKSCANTSTEMFTSPQFTIPAGTSKTISFPFFIPTRACAGPFTITTTTLVGGTPIDSTSATLAVN